MVGNKFNRVSASFNNNSKTVQNEIRVVCGCSPWTL